MADDIQPDQETYDRLIGAGESERTARAKAKSVAIRKARGVNRASLQQGDGQAAAEPAAAAEPTPAAAVATEAPAAAQPAAAQPAPAAPARPAARPAAAPGNGGRRLTPEERAARVAAAVATRGLPGQAGAAAKQGETHRLLAMVPPEGIQRAEARQEDKVNVWPHLLLREAVAAFAMFAFVTVFSMVVNAPLRELANSNLTPNPSKAPWYFLGLQELLRYFHPMVAGVTIPGIALLALMATPYFDRNPSMRPENRKLAIMMFTMFLMFWAILVLAGSFFRGPSFEWVWPWTETCSTPIHPDKTCLFFEF
ncbi:MAG TPA: menaquinol-cytochrome c reductase cytochrome b subunit [Actinomycetes bacterium]|nr:menaquinol-cytochrome c reductase cytochrome b subunit [Actinomycetes bacterium]